MEAMSSNECAQAASADVNDIARLNCRSRFQCNRIRRIRDTIPIHRAQRKTKFPYLRYVTDRMKNLIKPSGYQVSPREVEEVMAAHPAVAEVAVVGVPDEKRGEAVKAWVLLCANQHVRVDELGAFCRERLAPYEVPKHVVLRDILPKTSIGKGLRRELMKEG